MKATQDGNHAGSIPVRAAMQNILWWALILGPYVLLWAFLILMWAAFVDRWPDVDSFGILFILSITGYMAWITWWLGELIAQT